MMSSVAVKTVQIPDDYKLESFDVKSLRFTSIPLQLALHCTETAVQQSTVNYRYRHYGLTEPLPFIDLHSALPVLSYYLGNTLECHRSVIFG